MNNQMDASVQVHPPLGVNTERAGQTGKNSSAIGAAICVRLIIFVEAIWDVPLFFGIVALLAMNT